jgi:hypothetical protein
MDESLESLVAVAKGKISEIIQKPKMTEKLLSKPPFRFIHDTISAITAATGFAEGLYSGVELDSAAITEKQAKLDYLNKIFSLVGICKVSIMSQIFLIICLHSLLFIPPLSFLPIGFAIGSQFIESCSRFGSGIYE